MCIANLRRSLQRNKSAIWISFGEIALPNARQRISEVTILRAKLTFPYAARLLKRETRFAESPERIQDLSAIAELNSQIRVARAKAAFENGERIVDVSE